MFDDAGYTSSSTATPGGTQSYDDGDDQYGSGFEAELARRSPQWHGGLDVGLLVLRLVLGGAFVAHGLDKLFGWFTDLGMGATEQMLTQFGFTEPKILAWVLAVSETAGGALLVLGLFTPAGAAAVLGVMANVIAITWDREVFLGGVELELMFAAAAFTLLFTGPGRVALDRHTPWFRRAPVFGIAFLVIAAGATVVTLLVFR
ncbi:hypothetical protein BU204_04655 [Actinophytocola xanthii]|uniref:DoxX family protein n=2 Tax=Actinophytocola xanthii TaxID=1912961 RepID=A0A1Q8CWY1_9PSEU|nr:hypothetical protein BU204_04655 [Actinophytocola xanthii]